MPLRRLRRLLASSCRTQLKNNSFQLKSIKRNYFTLNQLRFDWRMKESRLKKKKTKRKATKFLQRVEIWANWLQADKARERERNREIERARGVERSLVSFFENFCYGCSSLWYMGQAGGEQDTRYECVLQALLFFDDVSSRANKLIWLSCWNAGKVPLELYQRRRPQQRQEQRRRRKYQLSFMSAPQRAACMLNRLE